MRNNKKRYLAKKNIKLKKENCFFCQKKIQVSYKKIDILKDFLSDRKKILGRSRSGLCQKHQKRLAREVKRARYLGLLPFVVKV